MIRPQDSWDRGARPSPRSLDLHAESSIRGAPQPRSMAAGINSQPAGGQGALHQLAKRRPDVPETPRSASQGLGAAKPNGLPCPPRPLVRIPPGTPHTPERRTRRWELRSSPLSGSAARLLMSLPHRKGSATMPTLASGTSRRWLARSFAGSALYSRRAWGGVLADI